MTTSHTPGPWSRHSYGYLVGPDGETPIYQRNATNLLAGSEQLVVEAEANVTLCAAAPELLAALEDMLSGWKYIRESHGDLYGVGWDRAQDNAEAAIRKARGET